MVWRKKFVLSLRAGLLLAAVLCISSKLARANGALVTAALPDHARAFAGDPESGNVAILHEKGGLSLYPHLLENGTLDGEIKEATGATFDALVHKSVQGGEGYFVTASAQSKEIQIFNDRTLKLVKTLSIEDNSATPGLRAGSNAQNGMALAASSSAKDPYVVCTGPALHRINIATLSDEGRITIAAGSDVVDIPDEIAVSADGALLYGRKTQVNPTATRCWRITPSKEQGGFTTTLLHSEQNNMLMCVPDAVGQFVACGRTLYSTDMNSRIADLPVTPIFFHAKQPFLLGYDNGTLTLLSLNTLTQVASIPLAADAQQQGAARFANRAPFRAGQRIDRLPMILTDNTHHNLLYCIDQTTVMIPEADLTFPEEAFLFASVEGPEALAVGHPAQIRVKRLDERATLELVSGPEGMTLVAGMLNWTPKQTDIGVSTVKLKLASGSRERIQEVPIKVRQLSATLPFAPEHVVLSADGQTMLALTYMRPASPLVSRQYQYQPPNAIPYCRVALVNLAALTGKGNQATAPTVIADRVLPVNLLWHVAALDDRYVYLPLRDTDAFLALSRTDLSEVRRIFAPGNVTALASAGGRLYVGCRSNNINDRRAQQAVFSLPGLDPVAVPIEPPPGPYQPSADFLTVPNQVAGCWLYNDILYDPSMTRPQLQSEPRGFLTPSQFLVNRDLVYADPVQRQSPLGTWGTQLRGSQLVRLSGQIVGQIVNHTPSNLSASPMVLLQKVPAAAILESSDRPVVQGTEHSMHLTATVSFFDLQTAAPVGSVTLFDEPSIVQRAFPGSTQNHMGDIGDALVAVVQDRVFVVPLTGKTGALDAAKLPMPLHFIQQQSAFITGADGVLRLKHQVEGGVGPMEFALTSEAPGLEIDKVTGTVTLIGTTLAASSTEEAVDALMRRRIYVEGGNRIHVDFDTSLARYRKSVAPRFALLTGREAAGIPMAFRIGVAVRDKNQQAANFYEVVLLDLPAEPIVAKAHAAEDLEMPHEFAAGGQRGAPASTQQLDNLQKRVTDLERENAVLRAKVEVLTDLMRNGHLSPRGPATRPN